MFETGNRIRKLRDKLDYSQQFVAYELGISQPAYARIEKGLTKLDTMRLLVLAKILEVEPLQLIAGTDDVEEIKNNPQTFVETLYVIYKENTQKLITQLEEENIRLKDEIKRYTQSSSKN